MSEPNFYPIDFDASGAGFVINNHGTAPAPCKITFIPKVDFYVLTIEGLSEEPIKMHEIRVNDVVMIDAETRTVLINDKDAFDKYDAWEFPKLQPGLNKVNIPNGIQAAIQIEFNPRYI